MLIENPFKNPEDKLLFAKTLDRLKASEKKRQATFTDFLNPVQVGAFINALKGQNVIAFGGYQGAERGILGFGIETTEDFPITPVIVIYNEKFSKSPTHRDYLGATIGLGLDRSKLGDIVLGEAGAVIYASSEIASYIAEHLTQVGRIKVKTTLDISKMPIETENTAQEKRITVASLRLDAVLSSGLNLSRSKVVTLIDNDKVFVNWKPGKKTQTLKTGDNITVRGMGRIVIKDEGGMTKKDRIVLTIDRY